MSAATSLRSAKGGATFTPRLPEGQRPEYPPFALVFRKTLGEFLRTGLICVLVTKAIFPYYLRLVDFLSRPNDVDAPEIDANGTNTGLGLGERGAFTLLTCLAHTATYVAICGGLEVGRWLGWWRRFEFRRLQRQVPTGRLIAQTLVLAALSQLLVSPLALWYLGYDSFKWFGMPPLTAELPSALEMFKCFTIARFFNEWGFYWVHRTVHTKVLYKTVHKLHHSYTGTIPITSEFATIPEVSAI